MPDIDDPPSPFHDDPPELRRPSPSATWRERIEQLADATGTTPARIAVGAVVVALAIAAAVWLLRPPDDPPEAALPYASTTSVPPPTTTTTTDVLVVHVAGSVRAPGLHELPGGSRVADAIEAAGGLLPTADATGINLAAPVADGERVYLLATGEQEPTVAVGGGGASGGGGGSASTSGPVNLNTADAEALDALPGIGPATASAILEHRAKAGPFPSVDALLDVPGIGDAKLEALRDLVTV